MGQTKPLRWFVVRLLTVALIASLPLPLSALGQSSAAGTPQRLPLESGEGSGGTLPELLLEKWRVNLWGEAIGRSRITVLDIDQDGRQEVVAGAHRGQYFWYIVSYEPFSSTYWQEWTSKPYEATIVRIAVADAASPTGYEIYVALSNGEVEVYDAATRRLLHTLTTGSSLGAIALADADGDSMSEIVACGSSRIAVYDAASYQLEWQVPYGGQDVAVANVDADPAPEVVTTLYVVDGVAHSLEWDSHDNRFGFTIQLADIDSDAMAEIIGAQTWYYIRAFDADVQSLKWQYSAYLDIDSLRVADIDNDTVQEVIYGDRQGGGIHFINSITLIEERYINNTSAGIADIGYGDPDGDGQVEVLWGAGGYTTGPDYLFVAGMISGMIEWQSSDLVGPLSALDVGDVDGDGTQEVAMVSFFSESYYEDGLIFVYNAETYELEWQSPPVMGGRAWTGVHALAIADVDDDLAEEIVIATDDLYDGVIKVYDGVTHAVEWQTATYDGAPFYALAVADVDNDGQTEVVGGQGREHTGAPGVYTCVFSGASGSQEWCTPDLGYSVEVYDVVVADTDADAHPEIIFGVNNGSAHVYDGVTGVEEWRSDVPQPQAVAAYDVDQDGVLEILVGTVSGELHAFDGQTYAEEWSESLSSHAIRSLRLGDLNRDTLPELILTDDQAVQVYDAGTRTLLWQSQFLGTQVGNGNHLAVGEIDRDGRDEVVFGTSVALHVFYVPLFGSSKEVDQVWAQPGDRLGYELVAQNLTPDALAMAVVDAVPPNTAYLTGTLWASAGSWEISGDTISWTVDIAPHGQVSLTFAVSVTPGVQTGDWINNTATYSTTGFVFSHNAWTQVDSAMPTTTILRPLAGEFVSGTLYLVQGTAEDPLSGLDHVEVNVGGRGWQLATGSTTWTYSWSLPLADTAVAIQARAVDRAGMVETPGPSVTVFLDNLSPYIVSTVPAHGSLDVLVNQPVVITMSEPIVSSTLEFLCQPDPGGWTLEVGPGGRRLTLRHDPFDRGRMYSFLLRRADDWVGHYLVAGPALNPWAFMTSGQPCQPSCLVYLPLIVIHR